MNTFHTPAWESLERRSPRLFLTGGILLLGIRRSTASMRTWPTRIRRSRTFSVQLDSRSASSASRTVPPLVEEHPRIARLGAVSPGLGTTKFAVIVMAKLGRIAGIAADNPPAWAVIVFAMAASEMLLGYLSFGVASLLAGVHPRRFGNLLFGPLVVFVFLLASSMSGLITDRLAVAISAGQAPSHLAIGVTVLAEDAPAGRPEASADATP